MPTATTVQSNSIRGDASGSAAYDPLAFKPLTFFDAAHLFRHGDNDPRRYLERCLDVIALREPVVKAWVVLNEPSAREAADASAKRWRDGQPLSSIDGMPIGIKDLIETKDMPTQMGCAAFEGNFPKRDSALVRALRDAGAVILGKLVTTELGGLHAGPTTNPFDVRRTPGGSSSGSAAAVGAGMIAAAIGTQAGGSVIRPASYCANWAMKPTLGAINRGERLTYGTGAIGVHAGSPVDMWRVAKEIALRAGGDPGRPSLFGPQEAPEPIKPQRLVVMETDGWKDLDAPTHRAFEQALDALRRAGVEIVRRTDSPLVESFERGIVSLKAIHSELGAFEVRWILENLVEQYPDRVSARIHKKLENGRKVAVDDVSLRLLELEEARHRLEALVPLGDALISVASSGPAPIVDPTSVRPTGEAIFNFPSTLLGAPAITVPLIAVAGMPVGIQIMGQQRCDAKVTSIARWLGENLAPIVVD